MVKNYEEMVLSSLLYEAESTHRTDSLDEISEYLKPFMFANEINRAIYESMLAGDTEILPIVRRLEGAYPDIKGILMGLVSDSSSLGVNVSNYASRIVNYFISKDVSSIIRSYEVDENNLAESIGTLVAMIEKKMPEEKNNGVLFSELPNGRSSKYFTKKPPKFLLGINSFDKSTGGLDKGDLHVIAARPSVGKSAFSVQLLLNNPTFKCGYFNMEMGEDQVYERLISKLSGIDMGHLRNAEAFLNNEESRYNNGIEKLRKLDNVRMFNGQMKVSQIRNHVRQNKFDVIIIDYLQLVIPDIDRGGQRAAEVGDISRGLKKIATDFNIPVIALSQLNRRSEATKEKEPTMADIRESGAIEQDASTIIMLWSHKDENKRNFKVEKARQGQLVRTELYFDGAQMTFSEVPISNRHKPVNTYQNVSKNAFMSIPDDEEIPFR